jgi:hypothetical protein
LTSLRNQAVAYLDKAIQLDPHYEAGRKRAEELKKQIIEIPTANISIL